jgi:hypothetical protein
MKTYLKKINIITSLTLAGLGVVVMLYVGGCATDTTPQSSYPAGSTSGSGAAPAPARPAPRTGGGSGGGGGAVD